MELGNMLLGNSRGIYPVPRDREWSEPLFQFMEKVGLEGHGFPCDFTNCVNWQDTYWDDGRVVIRPYDWDAECTCGAEEKMDACLENHGHSNSCYQTDLHEERHKAGLEDKHGMPILKWKNIKAKRQKEEEIFQKLAKKHNVDPFYGAMIHCTCGHDEEANRYWENVIGGHDENCRLVLPNFYDRNTGLKIQWYKYPLRDSYMNKSLSLEEWKELFQELNRC